MGGCMSRKEGCVGVQRKAGESGTGKRRRRRRLIKGRVSSSRKAIATMETIKEAPGADGPDRSFSNPTFQGGIEEDWFDTNTAIDSDCDDDFQSVQDDTLSLNGFDGAHLSTMSSFRDANHEDVNDNAQRTSSSDGRQNGPKQGEQSSGMSASSVNPQSDGILHGGKPFVSHNDINNLRVGDDAAGDEVGILDHCGILPHNCLPCLVQTAPIIEKRRSLSSSSPKKKAALKLSFKRRTGEGQGTSTLFSTKVFLERPLAGSQVPFCPVEKKIVNSWSRIEPNTFRLRGENYFRDKKKEFAPNYAAYYPFGVDVYLSQQKISHIGRFVDLPTVNSSSKLPPILIVNCQIPLYPATIFQNETEGEGINFVLYFRISESYSKELPLIFQENMRRLVDDELERVKGFPMETIVPFRERLKILGRIANPQDLPLNAAERKLMQSYNEKPVLSRPQHEFYVEKDYLEVDLDMHRFSYISRKGFETFLDRLKLCVLDFGLTIQGNKPEELPEQMLCCVRLNEIDYTKFQLLAVDSLSQEQGPD